MDRGPAAFLLPMPSLIALAEGAASRAELGLYGHVPPALEEALLKAALDGAPIPSELPACEALDPGWARLLPLLSLHPDEPRLPEALRHGIAEMRRRAAYRYFILKGELRAILALLDDDIPALLLKGFPLATQFYPHAWQRPMVDLDLCVPRRQFAAATARLQSAGWRAEGPDNTLGGIGDHALTLRGPTGIALDLHCRVLWCSRWVSADDRFWAGAVPLPLGNRATLTLNAADHLFHAFLHGVRKNWVSPIRWMVDACFILRSAGDRMDWERLRENARVHDCGGPVTACLRYLREGLGVGVPAAAVAAMARVPFTAHSDRWFRAEAAQPPPPRDFPRRLISLNRAYRRAARDAAPWPIVLPRLLPYFKAKHGIARWRDVPGEIAWRLGPPRPTSRADRPEES